MRQPRQREGASPTATVWRLLALLRASDVSWTCLLDPGSAAASLAAAQGNDVDDTLDKYGDLLNNAIDRLARLDCNLLHEHAPILLNYPKWLKKRAHQVTFLITFVMLPDTERSVQRAIELAILRTEDAAGYIDLR